MEITITGRNINLDDSIKEYIHKRLDKLERIYKRIYKCEVILEEEKIRKNVEILLYLKRNKIVAKETSPDIYTSIDSAAESIKKQMRRLNGKLSSKRRRSVLDRIIRPMSRFTEEENISIPEGGGKIVKTNTFADKPMLPEEAKLELELMGRDFLMFKNADTGQTNVLYKRTDSDYGLIEPNF